jgi:hypothetical protein
MNSQEIDEFDYGFDEQDENFLTEFLSFDEMLKPDLSIGPNWLLFTKGLLYIKEGKINWTYQYNHKILVNAPLLETFEEVEQAVLNYGLWALDRIKAYTQMISMQYVGDEVWPCKCDLINDERWLSLSTYASYENCPNRNYFHHFKKIIRSRIPTMKLEAMNKYITLFEVVPAHTVETLRQYLRNASFHMEENDINYELFSRVGMVYNRNVDKAFKTLGTDAISDNSVLYVSSTRTIAIQEEIVYNHRRIYLTDCRQTIKRREIMRFEQEEFRELKFAYKGYDTKQWTMHVRDLFAFFFLADKRKVVAPGDFGVMAQVGKMLSFKVVTGDIDPDKVAFMNQKLQENGIQTKLEVESWERTLERAEIDNDTVIVLSHLLSAIPEIAAYVARKYPNNTVIIYDHRMTFEGMKLYSPIRPFDYAFFQRHMKHRPMFRRGSQVYGQPTTWVSLPPICGIEEVDMLSVAKYHKKLGTDVKFKSSFIQTDEVQLIKDEREYVDCVQLFHDHINPKYDKFFHVKTGATTPIPLYRDKIKDFSLPFITPLEVIGKGLRQVTVSGHDESYTLVTKAPFVVNIDKQYTMYDDKG